jgi:integrase/recombinase XerD
LLEPIHVQVQSFHVAAFVHDLQDELSPPSVNQHLAAIRMLFDWLVTGHVIETNPARAVRGSRFPAVARCNCLLPAGR